MDVVERFNWTGRSQKAAVLIAEGRLNNRAVAAEVGVTPETLRRWRLHPEFDARVDSLIAAMARVVMEQGIADRVCRIQALNDRWNRLQEIVEARAKEMADVPGGSSGLLMKEMKSIKVEITLDDLARESLPIGSRARKTLQRATTRRSVEVPHYSLDVALIRELREHERQASIEMGQWKQVEPTVNMVMVAGSVAAVPALADGNRMDRIATDGQDETGD